MYGEPGVIDFMKREERLVGKIEVHPIGRKIDTQQWGLVLDLSFCSVGVRGILPCHFLGREREVSHKWIT